MDAVTDNPFNLNFKDARNACAKILRDINREIERLSDDESKEEVVEGLKIAKSIAATYLNKLNKELI